MLAQRRLLGLFALWLAACTTSPRAAEERAPDSSLEMDADVDDAAAEMSSGNDRPAQQMDADVDDAGAADSPCAWATSSTTARPAADGGELTGYLSSVVWADDAFVAGGFLASQQPNPMKSAWLVISCDGEHWQRVGVPNAGESIDGLAYGHGTLLAAGSGLHGPTLTVRKRGGAWQTFHGLGPRRYPVFGNGVFLVQTPDFKLLVSNNGIDWEPVTLTERTLTRLDISFDGDRFIAFHDQSFQTSKDGRTWSAEWNHSNYDWCGNIKALGTEILGFCEKVQPDMSDVRGYDQFTLRGARGSDPSSWAFAPFLENGFSLAPRQLAANSSKAVALGWTPLSASLPLGAGAWTKGTLSHGGPTKMDLAYGAGRFVIVGRYTYTSENGTDWEERTVPY